MSIKFPNYPWLETDRGHFVPDPTMTLFLEHAGGRVYRDRNGFVVPEQRLCELGKHLMEEREKGLVCVTCDKVVIERGELDAFRENFGLPNFPLQTPPEPSVKAP